MLNKVLNHSAFETIRTILYAIVLALFIRTFLFQVFLIPSGSMIPTFLVGDRVIVPKFTYGIQNPFHNAARKRKIMFVLPNPWYQNTGLFSRSRYWWKFKKEPKRFDILVFFPPEQPISGPVYYFNNDHANYPIYFRPPQLPGETYVKRLIGLPGDKLEIKNGLIYINDVHLPEEHSMNRDYVDFGPVKVPDDAYFAMGDNRSRSADSRVWGFLPKKNVLGHTVAVMWPPKNIRVIDPLD